MNHSADLPPIFRLTRQINLHGLILCWDCRSIRLIKAKSSLSTAWREHWPASLNRNSGHDIGLDLSSSWNMTSDVVLFI